MKGPARRKCLFCKEFYRPDHRNLRHQRYCSKPACRKEKDLDIRSRMHSGCRTMLVKGCPRELPGFDRWIEEKRRVDGVRIGES